MKIFEKIIGKVTRKNKPDLSPARVLVFGFLTIILIGGTLLLLPIARRGEYIFSLNEILNSYFTAVSATCVTGLVSCDTAATWSIFGQAVILCMIQVGGLGFMTLTVIFARIIRKKISPRQHILIAQSLNVSASSGLLKLVKRILIGTFTAETVGALILMTRFIPEFGKGEGIWFGFFHSISAFCNAGFDLLGNYGGEFSSIAMFKSDPVVLLTLACLIMFGGIGFIVWDELYEHFVHKRRFSVYTRFVLIITAILVGLGTVLIFFGELTNPETLGGMSFIDKITNAFFQSVTTRTAGFDAFGNSSMRDFTKIICIMLMFIGGASGSTAGGIKVGTMGLLVYTVYSAAIGKTQIVLFKRKISHANVFRAMAIASIGATLALIVAFIIQLSSDCPFIAALYESVSAFATVGLSVVGTPVLHGAVKLLLMMLMFFGRVGVLTITFSLLVKLNREEEIIKYPEAQMLIG